MKLVLFCVSRPLPDNVRLGALSDGQVEVVGLAASTAAGVNYELRIDGTLLRDLTGNAGTLTTVAWTHDTVAPAIPDPFGLTLGSRSHLARPDSGGKHAMTPGQYVEWAARR